MSEEASGYSAASSGENREINSMPNVPMILFTIKRTHYRDDGVFGVMDREGQPFCVTIELPWKNNQKEISCIPEGEYLCERFLRSSGQETFLVLNVPNRDGILIHTANTISDLRGCIGIAEFFHKKDVSGNTQTSVGMSKDAFNEFMNMLSGQKTFKLVIVNKS